MVGKILLIAESLVTQKSISYQVLRANIELAAKLTEDGFIQSLRAALKIPLWFSPCGTIDLLLAALPRHCFCSSITGSNSASPIASETAPPPELVPLPLGRLRVFHQEPFLPCQLTDLSLVVFD